MFKIVISFDRSSCNYGAWVAGKLGPSSLYILYIGIGYIYKFYTLYWMCNARIILSQASLTFLVTFWGKLSLFWEKLSLFWEK